MTTKPCITGALALLSLTACAPAGDGPSDPPATQEAAAAGQAKEDLQVDVAPDVDPATGIDRNVTYEPQLAQPERERPRKDPGKTAPEQVNGISEPE